MRPALIIVPLAAALVGACGGSGGSGAATAATDEERALEFVRCLREEGIDIPDPKPGTSGAVVVRVRPGGPGAGMSGPDPARMEAAQRACRKYAPNGGKPPSAAQQQELRDGALAFARCMRANGVDLPDPQVGSGGVTVGGPGSAFDPASPTFKKAEAACKDKLPMGDRTGPGPQLGVGP